MYLFFVFFNCAEWTSTLLTLSHTKKHTVTKKLHLQCCIASRFGISQLQKQHIHGLPLGGWRKCKRKTSCGQFIMSIGAATQFRYFIRYLSLDLMIRSYRSLILWEYATFYCIEGSWVVDVAFTVFGFPLSLDLFPKYMSNLKKLNVTTNDAEQGRVQWELLLQVRLLRVTQRKVIIFNINFVPEPFFSIKCSKLAVTSTAFHLIAAYLISASSLCEMCCSLDCDFLLQMESTPTEDRGCPARIGPHHPPNSVCEREK